MPVVMRHWWYVHHTYRWDQICAGKWFNCTIVFTLCSDEIFISLAIINGCMNKEVGVSHLAQAIHWRTVSYNSLCHFRHRGIWWVLILIACILICIKLENVKKLKVPFFLLIFYYWSWGPKKLSGTLVRIPISILPVLWALLSENILNFEFRVFPSFLSFTMFSLVEPRCFKCSSSQTSRQREFVTTIYLIYF